VCGVCVSGVCEGMECEVCVVCVYVCVVYGCWDMENGFVFRDPRQGLVMRFK